MNEELKDTQVEKEVEEQNISQKEAEEAPIKTLMQSLNEKFDNSANITKKIIVLVAVFIGLLCGYGIGKIGMVEKDVYNNAIRTYQDLKTDYDTYKEKMQPYEAQQEADVKAAEEAKAKKEAEEKAKKEAEEKAKREAEEKAKKEAEEKARKETEEKAAQAALEQSQTTYTEQSQDTSSLSSGVLPKSYKPTGNEPNWIEIISYCEVQMPEVIGYDASISTYESDTTIIKTGLRYKIETDRLKIKSDKSYHKAIFIIEFKDDTYEYFHFDTAEVDGIKIR